MQHLLLDDAFLEVLKFLQDLYSELVAQVVPLLLQAAQLLNVRVVYLVLVVVLDLHPVWSFSLLVTCGFEEESKQMTCLPNQIRSLLVLLLNTKFSQLLDADDQHVQFFESCDGMRHVLLGTIKLPDLDAAGFNDFLRFSGILADCHYLLDKDHCLIIN